MIADVSLGTIGVGLTASLGQLETIEYIDAKRFGFKNYLEDTLTGKFKIKNPVHCAIAWKYRTALKKSLKTI